MTGKQLYASVKAGFVSKHSSLHSWCVKNEIARQNARAALLGKWSGPKARDLVQKLIDESGVQVYNFNNEVVNQSSKPDARFTTE